MRGETECIRQCSVTSCAGLFYHGGGMMGTSPIKTINEQLC